MNGRTRHTNIPPKVKAAVWERDGGCCIYCGSAEASPSAHYISRAQGGLGIEENILTLCMDCHRRYDNTIDREHMRDFFRIYLKSKYLAWNEEQLVFKKGGSNG